MTKSIFDSLYAAVPAPQRQALELFRETHPEQHTPVNGTEWAYLKSGDGEQTILLLVGGLRVADAAHLNIPMLEDDFRVITHSYPGLSTMADLADGLAGLLDDERIDQCTVLAGSFGGMLAQVFVRRYPARVRQLILSTTAVPNQQNVQQYQQGLAMLQAMNEADAAEASQQVMFGIIDPPEDSHAFYQAYLKELFTIRLSKHEIISTYEALIDFAENYSLKADDLHDWPGEILILESDNDGTFDAPVRAAVREIYPQAQSYVFYGAGHSPGTTQRDLYFRVVKAFLRGEPLPTA